MTAYITTPEQHAQIVDALTQWTTPNWAGSGVDQCNAALSMLKAMKPVEPEAWLIEFENGESELHFYDTNNSLGETQVPLYAKEQQ